MLQNTLPGRRQASAKAVCGQRHFRERRLQKNFGTPADRRQYSGLCGKQPGRRNEKTGTAGKRGEQSVPPPKRLHRSLRAGKEEEIRLSSGCSRSPAWQGSGAICPRRWLRTCEWRSPPPADRNNFCDPDKSISALRRKQGSSAVRCHPFQKRKRRPHAGPGGGEEKGAAGEEGEVLSAPFPHNLYRGTEPLPLLRAAHRKGRGPERSVRDPALCGPSSNYRTARPFAILSKQFVKGRNRTLTDTMAQSVWGASARKEP